MLSDPITLYKLMILYMLDHVNFPLTNSQLTDFFLDHEYTTYFTLQQALNELKEAGLIRMESTHNSSRYEITKEGDDTLSFFGNNISPDHRGYRQLLKREQIPPPQRGWRHLRLL